MTIAEYKALAAKQPKKRGKPEAKFQKAAIQYLQLRGFTVKRVNSSAMTAESGSYLRAYILEGRGENASKGFPDLEAYKGDRFLVIETKSKNGHLSQSQKDFKQWWESRGHKYNVANNLDQLIKIVEEFEND